MHLFAPSFSSLVWYPNGCSTVMRWLMIALLVSLGALLIAAAGMARHIWRSRAQIRSNQSNGSRIPLEAGDEVETESEL